MIDNPTRPRQERLTEEQRKAFELRFFQEVWPVLSFYAVDRTHPFPRLRSRNLYLAILLHGYGGPGEPVITLVEVPAVLGRAVDAGPASGGKVGFILIEDMVAMHVDKLFPQFRVAGCTVFRVTRGLRGVDGAADTSGPETPSRCQEGGEVVQLEIAKDSPEEIETFLRRSLHLGAGEVRHVDRPLQLQDLPAPSQPRQDVWLLPPVAA
jgi:polyphosphate kinase